MRDAELLGQRFDHPEDLHLMPQERRVYLYVRNGGTGSIKPGRLVERLESGAYDVQERGACRHKGGARGLVGALPRIAKELKSGRCGYVQIQGPCVLRCT